MSFSEPEVPEVQRLIADGRPLIASPGNTARAVFRVKPLAASFH